MEFAYKLNDQVSGPMRAIAAASKETAKQSARVESELDKVNHMLEREAALAQKDPAKKKAALMKMQLDQLRKQEGLQKKEFERLKGLQDLKTKQGETDKKQIAAVLEAMGAVASASLAAGAAVAALGVGLAVAAVKASQLRKQTERKLSFSFGKDNASGELDIVNKIRDATGRDQAEIVGQLTKLKNIGFSKEEAENIATLASDAGQASAEAADAVNDAYTQIKKTQNDLVNLGRGSFDKGAFDKLVESGAVDRAQFLADLAKEYKVSQNQAVRLLSAGMVRGDVGESVLTKNLRGRFNGGGAVGKQSIEESNGNVGKQVSAIQNKLTDMISKVDTRPLERILVRISSVLDPNNASAQKVVKGLETAFAKIEQVTNRIDFGKVFDTAGAALGFFVDRATMAWKQGERIYDVWVAKVNPELSKLAVTLQPATDALAKFYGTGSDLKVIGFVFEVIVRAIGLTVSAINEVSKSFISLFTDVSSLTTKMGDIGKDLVLGLVKGITGAYDLVKDAVNGLGGVAVDTLKNALGIHSPSRVMMQMGGYTAEGFALGVNRGPVAQIPGVVLPPPPTGALAAGISGGAAQGGGSRSIGDIKIEINVSGGGGEAGHGRPGGELASQIGDTVRNELLKFVDSLGFSTGDIGTTA